MNVFIGLSSMLLLGQSGPWMGDLLHKLVRAAETRLRQAEQHTPPSQTSPPECANGAECARTPEYAKQKKAQADVGEAILPPAEGTTAGERQVQLRAISSDLLSWK